MTPPFLLSVLICQSSRVATSQIPADHEQLDVLVLGAGIAGVKAAATLHQAGVERFLVLEQAPRIGGRMWNLDWHGWEIELGANWIEGIPQKENPIWKIAQDIGLKGNYTNQEGSRIEPVLFTAHGRVSKVEAKVLHSRLKNALEKAKNVSCHRHMYNLGDAPLRDGLLAGGWPAPEKQTALERTLEFFVVDWDFEFSPENVSMFNYFSTGHADSWKEVCYPRNHPSANFVPRARTAFDYGLLGNFSWESPRYFVTDPRGYAAVAEHVAKSFAVPGKPRIVFNENVTSILYGGDRVEVSTSSGNLYRAKYAITTFSAGVINHAVRSKTLFHPELPEWKSQAYGKARNGIYTKIFLWYNISFWEDADYVLFAHPSRRGYYAVWQDMESNGKFLPEGAHILMVTVVQEDSEKVEKQSKHATIAELQGVLRMMYGANIPEPIDILVPIWGANPSFRGCWSNIALNTKQEDFEAAQRPIGGLYFAGESTDYDFNGFVAGGYTSGERAARAVLGELHGAFDITV